MKSVHEHARLVYQAMHNAETARYKTASEAAECHAFDLIRERDSEHAAARDRLIESLHRIAAWHDGDVVTGKFDEPCAAREARAALGAIGIWAPPPNRRGNEPATTG